MRTTISLPDPLLENARRAANAQGVTLSELVADALRRHVANDRIPNAPKFRLHTVRGRLVNPEIDLDRTSALLTRDDEAAFARKKPPLRWQHL
jgi:hypothetical protein